MSLTILCPNGRRQTMKVNPNTSILEILEYVCEKQELDSKEYELTRNNKVLDLSLTIRFANIPNNGQLDLKKASFARKDQKVTIAIDLEDGVRQIMDFESNQNLWEVIHVMFENNEILNLEPNKEFCIIYIGKEIVGETQLKQTNLKSLGLAQGRAAMKLLVRTTNAVKEQAFVESLNLKKEPKKSDNKRINETNSQRIQQTNKDLQNIIPKPEDKVKQQSTPLIDSAQNSESVAQVFEINDSDDQKVEQKASDVQKMEIQSEESEDEGEETVNFLGSNNKEILFKMSDLPKVSKIDYPDHFYETTKDDLIHVLKDLQKQQGTEKQLETKQMREQRKREQMKRYKSTVIRICFPNDRLVFQAIFKPTDTVQYVMQVLSRYINNINNFYLYTTPPKHVLKPESSLYETDLVPAALIHFKLKGVESEQMVIKEEFKSKLTSFKSAAKIANSARLEGKPSDVEKITDTNPPVKPSGNTNSDKKESTVPKWFKTNK